MKSFTVSWHASGTTGTFSYEVIATDITEAKQLWDEFVWNNDQLRHTWERARKGDIYHTGGFTNWNENEETTNDKKAGCYEIEYHTWDLESDHIRD